MLSKHIFILKFYIVEVSNYIFLRNSLLRLLCVENTENWELELEEKPNIPLYARIFVDTFEDLIQTTCLMHKICLCFQNYAHLWYY